jgi:hypothetical protein
MTLQVIKSENCQEQFTEQSLKVLFETIQKLQDNSVCSCCGFKTVNSGCPEELKFFCEYSEN